MVKLFENQKATLTSTLVHQIQMVETLKRLHSFSGGDDSVRKHIAKLRKPVDGGEGFIDSAPITSKHVQYFLTKRGASYLHRPRVRTGALTGYGLLNAVGSLLFCFDKLESRKKVARHKFKERFPELSGGSRVDNYYLDSEDGPLALGTIYVSSTSVDKGVFRSRILPNIIEARRQQSEFWQKRIDGGGFVVALVAGWEERVEELRAIVRDVYPHVPVRTFSDSLLLDIVARRRNR